MILRSNNKFEPHELRTLFDFMCKRVIHTLFLGLLFGISACSPLRLINIVVDEDAYILTENLAYGSLEAQKLDVYQPEIKCRKCPVLIWVHGGAWQSGSKDLYTFIGGAFTAAGMVVVIPDYRKYPNLFPNFMQDTAKAISWVRENIAQYGGDADNLNLMGHSSGAHISILLAFDSHYLQQVGVPVSALQTIMGLAGPYDFLPLKSPVIKQIFSTTNPLSASQPITFASDLAPPILLAAGMKDKRVDPQNSVRMAAAVKASGGNAQLILYPAMGHSKILLSLSKPLRGVSSVYQDVLDFLYHSGVLEPPK